MSPPVFRRLTFVTVVVVGLIIVTGAAVRLTGSGLGCPDWPRCNAERFVGDLGSVHTAVEQLNRLFTGIVVLVPFVTVIVARLRQPYRRDLFRLALGVLAAVLANGLIGGAVVLLELDPVSVIAHFLVSMGALWLALVLHHRAGQGTANPVVVVPHRLLVLGRSALGLACLVLATGTLVTATGPHSGDERAERLHLMRPDWAARIHGTMVWLLLAVVVVLVWRAWHDGTWERLGRCLTTLLVLVLIQGAIGYTQYFTGVPALLVGVHVGGAIAVFSTVVVTWLTMSARDVEVRPAVPVAVGAEPA